MKKLIKNGQVVNVFTGEIENTNILIENDTIIGIGDYLDSESDVVEDVSGKFICPGFIDGHIHIESTMLLPSELARVSVPHGTTTLIADPHEIANVCGTNGIEFMLEASKNIPMTIYMVLPSCVPATAFDESGATMDAETLKELYSHPGILGLGEMMNYPGVLANDPQVMQKIADARELGKIINGHAPLLCGKQLDKYITAGINDDHECSNPDEAKERIRKGQWLMIRQGTAARNLQALLPMFDEPYAHRCLLVTDDKHPADLLAQGHIDNIIRLAVEGGKSVITGIQMATIQAAECLGLSRIGAIAPGYIADFLVLDDLDSVRVRDVYKQGEKVVSNGKMIDFPEPPIKNDIRQIVLDSFHMKEISPKDFYIEPESERCRVIKTIPDQLLTEEWITDINWAVNNGIDTTRDILKIAVIERHSNTGHIGKGFISGINLQKGAIASSVSHDSHNLIVIGANDEDMALAANHLHQIGGGLVVVSNGKVVADMALPIAGLMSFYSAKVAAEQNEKVREAVHELNVPDNIEPFMLMAFMSLPVIPALKITSLGLVDVNLQKLVPLFVSD